MQPNNTLHAKIPTQKVKPLHFSPVAKQTPKNQNSLTNQTKQHWWSNRKFKQMGSVKFWSKSPIWSNTQNHNPIRSSGKDKKSCKPDLPHVVNRLYYTQKLQTCIEREWERERGFSVSLSFPYDDGSRGTLSPKS